MALYAFNAFSFSVYLGVIYNTFFIEDGSFIEQLSFFRLNFLIILDVAEMHLGQFQLPLWRFFEF